MNNNRSVFKIIIIVFLGFSLYTSATSEFVNRFSFLTGTFPVIFIAVAAIIFLAIVKEQKSTQGNQNSSKSNNCSECGSHIHPYDKFCKNCGVKVHKEVICDYCGTKNSSDALMCKNCNGLLK